MVVVGFSKQTVVIRCVFIKIELGQVKGWPVQQPFVTWNCVIAMIGGLCSGMSKAATWFMFLCES